ncbi:hypothetical protein [Streptomyces sp. NPDC017529]|uniref:hypothetical protein n=1 Tax=Streptomyces sp. NPDC017529 TaxID=3365000 RepID=UPI0037B9C35C
MTAWPCPGPTLLANRSPLDEAALPPLRPPPGALTPEDQAVVDQDRAMLAAVRHPEPWTPGRAQDVAVRIGPFIERAQPRPGDDHGTDMIAVALVHPDTPHAGAYLHRRQLGYTERGWLRCETTAIIGTWQPGYAILTHAAADLPLPDDIGMDPAHYALYIEARRRDDSRDGYTLLRLGPYTQTWHAQQDHDRITTALDGRETALVPGHRVAARFGPFDVSDHQLFADPYGADAMALLDAAVAGVSA